MRWGLSEVRRRHLNAGMLVGLLLCPLFALSAQTKPSASAALPIYDVTSVKLNTSGSFDSSYNTSGVGSSARNVSLRQLMEYTFEIKENLIEGIPGPVNAARFDLDGKISDPDPETIKRLTDDQRRAMMAPVLAERFQLQTHRETKMLPLYELVLAKDGSKLKPSAAEGAPEPAGIDPRVRTRGDVNWGSEHLLAHAIPLSVLAHTLSDILKRTVTDKTALEGEYDITLHWTPDTAIASDDQTAGSIFTALQEQLGLRLRPSKGLVETLVVDRVNMPSDN